MRYRTLLSSMLLTVGLAVGLTAALAATISPAQQPAPVQIGGRTQTAIVLWPEGVPGAIKDGGAEVVAEGGRISNVHEPTLTPYLAPEGHCNGTAVVVCPGGGYTRLAADHEGRVPA